MKTQRNGTQNAHTLVEFTESVVEERQVPNTDYLAVGLISIPHNSQHLFTKPLCIIDDLNSFHAKIIILKLLMKSMPSKFYWMAENQ